MSDTEQKPTRTRTTTREPEVSDALLDRIVEATEQRISARVYRPNPMSLDTWEEIERFAEYAAKTDFVPRDFKNKPGNIIIAVMKGKELGLPAIQSLESIAIVNGRSSVYGEAVPGLCWASGKVKNIEEFYEGEEGTDGFTAVCIAERKGNESKFVGKFSQKDAKVAGLHGKDTHGKYPKAMMMWRARKALHDAFPDVLRGIGTRELEAEDAIGPPSWAMPKPEQSWFKKKPTAQSDGWDNTWFEGFAVKLLDEQNAWKWVGLLQAGLAEAPTIRDVEEIGDLPVVQAARDSAPEEGKNTIDGAFANARARFKPPVSQPSDAATGPSGSTAPTARETPAAPATPAPAADAMPDRATAATPSPEEVGGTASSGDAAFSAWLLDEAGDAVEEFSDPLRFAEFLQTLWGESGNRVGLMEQNADGIADAIAASPEAKIIIDECAEPSEDVGNGSEAAPEAVVIEVPVVRGQQDWKAYMATLKGELTSATADRYLDFLAANYPTLEKAPAHTKPLIIKLYTARAKALDIDPPTLLADAMKPPQPSGDKDAQIVEGLIAELADCRDAHAVNAWSGRMTTAALRSRFEREGKTSLLQAMLDAQKARLAELRAGA